MTLFAGRDRLQSQGLLAKAASFWLPLDDLRVREKPNSKSLTPLYDYISLDWDPGNWTQCLETRLAGQHALGINTPWEPQISYSGCLASGNPNAPLFWAIPVCLGLRKFSGWGMLSRSGCGLFSTVLTPWDTKDPPGFGDWEHGDEFCGST